MITIYCIQIILAGLVDEVDEVTKKYDVSLESALYDTECQIICLLKFIQINLIRILFVV